MYRGRETRQTGDPEETKQANRNKSRRAVARSNPKQERSPTRATEGKNRETNFQGSRHTVECGTSRVVREHESVYAVECEFTNESERKSERNQKTTVPRAVDYISLTAGPPSGPML